MEVLGFWIEGMYGEGSKGIEKVRLVRERVDELRDGMGGC